MSDMLEHRGYYGSVSFSVDDRLFVGKIEFIDDLILFDGENVSDLEAAFKDSVDAYLSFCAEQGKEPCTTYKGTFNVRVGSDLHRKAAVAAKKNNQSLNDFVKYAIEHVLYEDPRAHEKPVHHHHHHHLPAMGQQVNVSYEQEFMTEDLSWTERASYIETRYEH
ncbi:type II toxin-antitoxin system HicB family antitoxin [Ralstonia sp. 25mfcol4.1]|uniref:type II toxin-antitoxin system HicB family antitoxin n=1 Tax=Ralstonia sp. 25mfcol4.1 TaxID=1761899 RepID=UPI000B89FC41|nr:type II toxin-antitoxin system HicB family antitoxin [Ralstonia sp. 25mfcol4.1]